LFLFISCFGRTTLFCIIDKPLGNKNKNNNLSLLFFWQRKLLFTKPELWLKKKHYSFWSFLFLITTCSFQLYFSSSRLAIEKQKTVIFLLPSFFFTFFFDNESCCSRSSKKHSILLAYFFFCNSKTRSFQLFSSLKLMATEKLNQ